MSNSVRPHKQWPTRLPRPWDSPGKNTGVGCHFLLQCMKGKSKSEVTQSCPTLHDPMVCSLPGSSVHGIFQARVLEWGAIAFSKYILYIYIYITDSLCITPGTDNIVSQLYLKKVLKTCYFLIVSLHWELLSSPDLYDKNTICW